MHEEQRCHWRFIEQYVFLSTYCTWVYSCKNYCLCESVIYSYPSLGSRPSPFVLEPLSGYCMRLDIYACVNGEGLEPRLLIPMCVFDVYVCVCICSNLPVVIKQEELDKGGGDVL